MSVTKGADVMKKLCCSMVGMAGAAAIAMSAALDARAATSYLVSGANSRQDSFYTASRWSPAVAPNNADGSANADGAATDFAVTDGLQLRPPESNVEYSFGGHSLTLGAVDFSSAGHFGIKGNRYMKFADIRLRKGSIQQHSNGWSGLAGGATVYSPASDPFVFRLKGKYDNYVNFTFTGGETTAIRFELIDGEVGKNVYCQADQSATYSGSWIIGTNVCFYAYKNSNYGGNSTAAMQFGKNLETFNPEALVMEDGSRLRYEIGNPRTFPASANRGLTVRDGVASYQLVNGFSHDFGWPIAGPGTLRITGAGTFNLRASCGAKLAIDGAASRFVLCSGASVGSSGGLSLPEGYVLSLEGSGDSVTVHNLVATNLMLKFPVSADGTAHARLRLAGDLNLSGVTGIGFSQVPNVSAATDLPVIVIDSAVTREFTAADFSPFALSGCQIPNATGVKVERDSETGDQIVSICLVPYIKTRLPVGSKNWGYFEAWAWGDGSSVAPAVGDGNNYLTWDTYIGANAEGESLTVPGESIILYNPSKTGFGMYLRHKKTTFNRLLALDRTMLWAYSYYTGTAPTKGQPHEVAGNVEVQTTSGSEFSFIAARSQIDVSATITGSGTIRARSTSKTYTPESRVTLSGENTGYSGAVHAYNDVDVVGNTCALSISSEENLGGNPLVFAPDALLLGYGCVFAPSAAVTIDDANRGVTFAATTNTSSTVLTGPKLDLAYDFTVKTPVVFEEGAFTKTNSGTFAWGKGGATVASGAALSVAGGAVKPQGFSAVGAMALSFSGDGAIAFDFPLAGGDTRAECGVDMRSAALSHGEGGLPVRLDFDADAGAAAFHTCVVPLAAFADASSALAFVDDAIVSAPRGYGVSLSVVEKPLGSATAAVVVATVKRLGCVISIR